MVRIVQKLHIINNVEKHLQYRSSELFIVDIDQIVVLE